MDEPAAAMGGGPPASLWRNRAFVRLWLAQAVSNAGSAVTAVALPLTAVVVLGATPAQMGLLGLAGALPNLLFGLAAGVWVDRARRRPLLVGADLGRALLFASIPVAAALGRLTFGQLWAVAFLAGTLTVFFQVAAVALLPSLVAPAQLVAANSTLSVSDSVVAVAGPGIAGGLVQLLGAPRAMLADAASYVVSALSLGGIGAGEPRPTRSRRGGVWGEVREGVRELLGTPLLRALTLTSSLGTLAAAAQGALLILFLSRELRLAPATIGLAFACGGGGSLLGALTAGRLARRLAVGPTMLLGNGIRLVGSALLPLAGLAGGALPLVVAGQLLAGFGSPLYFVNQVSLRQALTPVRLLGRVTAARRFVLFGTASIGAALGGVLGGAIGVRPTLALAAAVFAVELAALCFSPVRRVRG